MKIKVLRYFKLILIICTLIVFFCCSCNTKVRSSQSKPITEPITALLGAFEREIIMLEDQLEVSQERRIEGMRFVSGKLNSRRVVVAWTGIGKVNAAMTTTLLIEHFRPNEVIFSGIAGGINPQLEPGDIVIAAETAQHDMGVLTAESFYHRGAMNPLNGWRNPVFLPADKRLLELAERAAKQVNFETIKTIEGERKPKIIKGIVVTGDVFVASPQKCEELRRKLEADAVEMEGAAVAQICYQQGVPHIVIRSISDKADDKAIEDLQTFQQMAAKNSARLIVEMVGLLEKSKIKNQNAKTQDKIQSAL